MNEAVLITCCRSKIKCERIREQSNAKWSREDTSRKEQSSMEQGKKSTSRAGAGHSAGNKRALFPPVTVWRVPQGVEGVSVLQAAPVVVVRVAAVGRPPGPRLHARGAAALAGAHRRGHHGGVRHDAVCALQAPCALLVSAAPERGNGQEREGQRGSE